MELPLRIDEFRERFGNLPRSRFLERFSAPFLVIEMRGRKKTDGMSAWARTTTSKLPTLPAVRLSSAVIDTYVAPVEKSDRNDFKDVVSLGRDRDNDIVLPNPSVSKYHAVIRRDAESGAISVGDVGSLNGTTIGGHRLGEGDAAPLESGAVIVFGKSVQATFFEPDAFYDYLRLLQRLMEGRSQGP